METGTAAEQSGKAGFHRRRFQYSLRTLFVLMTLSAVACSWLAVRMQQAKRQQQIVEAIEKLGGVVMYEYQGVPGTSPPGPNWLRRVLGTGFFTDVNRVDFTRCPVTDAALEHLALSDLRQLQRPLLTNTQVTIAARRQLTS